MMHISYTQVWVKDQSEALRFYTEKLGFEIRNDVTYGDFRWLTVGLKDQPDLELGLMSLTPGDSLSEEDAEALRALQEKGKLGGILFESDDVQAVYETYKANGVEFRQPPTKQPYGIIEAIFSDNSGNWFSLQQPA